MVSSKKILKLLKESERCLSRSQEIHTNIRNLIYHMEEKISLMSHICQICEKKDLCQEACPKVLSLLPAVTSGRGRRENLNDLSLKSLIPLSRIRSDDLFEVYKSCRSIFTKKQWAVIRLYYYEDQTQEQIANQLKIRRSSVSELLTRAQARKEAYDRKLREERLTLCKKTNLSDET